MTVVLLVAGAITSFGLCYNFFVCGAFRSSGSYPNFVFEEKNGKVKLKKNSELDPIADKPLFDGELYQTSLRLQEACDLAIASVLFTAGSHTSAEVSSPDAYVQGMPQDARSLLTGLNNNNILPPGVMLSENMTLYSQRAIMVVRYRVEPFALEVLSLPRQEGKGPGLLIRLADDRDGDAVKYFESMNQTGLKIPEAFSPAANIIEQGWMPRQLNAQIASSRELARARQWLSQEVAAVKKP